MSGHRFPEGFVWGAATSAHQIEGAFTAGGRGESIWDRYSRKPGAVARGEDASVACDHYRLWPEDLDRLKWLGVHAYRFSIAWPRILPIGRGLPSEAGLDFYDQIVDGLLERGIRPFVTLYHWDLPQALQNHGGWASRSTGEAFTEYASVVARRLGDRVKDWITHNEPWCIATLGHEQANHAPGHADGAESLAVAHHLMLSHGWAVRELRRESADARVGIVLNLTPGYPASDSEEDRDAVRAFDGFFNRWYLDPLYRGSYPEDAIRDRVRQGHLPEGGLPFVRPGDLDVIRERTDFLGVNYYSRVVLKATGPGQSEAVTPVPEDQLTDMGWEVFPEGFDRLLQRVHDDYAPGDIYITENGCAYGDGPDATGAVADTRRTEFFRSHLEAVGRAMDGGVPVRGYFAWSLLDNFEWAHGYAKRFGLFWVDYETQERIAKNSAHWFREVVATNTIANDGIVAGRDS